MLRLRLSVIAAALLLGNAAAATTRTVTTLSDTSDGTCDANCSLRDALTAASAGDTIVFDPALTAAATPNAPAVLSMSLGEVVVNKNLTVTGPGADVLALDANALTRVLRVSGGVSATVTGLTLRNGRLSVSTPTTGGGGVFVEASSSLQMQGCVVSGNRVVGDKGIGGTAGGANGGDGSAGQVGLPGLGGGVYSAGTLLLRDSAVVDNEAQGGDGGIGGNGGKGGFAVNGGKGGVGGSGGLAAGGGVYGTPNTQLLNVTLAGNALHGGTGGNGGAGGAPGSGGGSSAGQPGNGGGGGNARGAGVYATGGTGPEIAFATFAAQLGAPGPGGNPGGSGATGGVIGTLSGLSLYGSGAGMVVRGSVIGDVLSPCGGTYAVSGQNLQAGTGCSGFTVNSTDPKFSPIHWNGGRTPNFLPHKGSAVLDAATDCNNGGGAVTADQRGLARPSDGNGDGNAVCDLGAVESDRIFDHDFET